MAGAGRLRFGRGSSPAPLSDVTFLMGDRSKTGCGSRLSSPTLGLLNNGTVTNWTVTLLSGTTNVLQDGAGVAYATLAPHTFAEGSTALTPEPTSAASGGSGVLSGSWTFSISATGSFGTSNTVTFTINLQANSASIGNNTTFSSPTSFVNALDVAAFCGLTGPRYLLLSKGIERGATGITWNNFHWTAEVIMRDADPADPDNKSNLDFLNIQNTEFLTFQGMRWDGATWTQNFRVRLFTVADIKFDDCDHGQTAANLRLSKIQVTCDGSISSTNRLTITNNRARWTFQAFELQGTNITVDGIVSRYQHRPVLHLLPMTTGSISNVSEMSFVFVSGSGFHTEGLQRHDFAQLQGVTIDKYEVFAADSTWMGPGYFAGTPTDGFPDTDITVSRFVYAGWFNRGTDINGNAGTTVYKNITLVKTNTGTPDPSLGPLDGGFTTDGPSMNFDAANSGMWGATLATQRCYMGNTVVTARSAVGGVSESLNIKKANASMAADFALGDPNVVLPAISTAAWAAMSDATVISTYRAALSPLLGGPMLQSGAYVGAYNPDGSWNTA
jgi:hypothetical protein